ncbi:hypothetical protein Desaci_2734 [Desulfosporosinus acidiphilus SJ4]|uniref:Uncharacterized protein n=1 Tax=Desulfosporosinus acidiphilus (strain DSM 22704 / JCM 16185 / SJ4) TaxID=646529 RepID=I4D790_DESAJ|nr:hypothetical protein [Desulfosporosinus acidiphilus]AFM41664.1 hypothetical protein Desaci_2734 [Desulfosporosinus acidiphilus SJ4]
MLKQMYEFKRAANTRHNNFKVGDRVKTNNLNDGAVVRVDRDENGLFLVVRLDISPIEFIYEPEELEKIS